ncbi:hypothetical protein SteCoe_35127 [Stentor coeruleus]|uniref:Dickkopf N-terminal cysteine-rich domain-containing protein n=1 Tax=Stentor coeruleus TaxID=5963 RepID=A0A1R2ATC2_9CILI|nr:hypothetical protein SteCoe_35127 [Stentor coeruleus]
MNLFTFLLHLISAITTDNCKTIQCGPGITSDNCIEVIDDTVSVYGCKAGYICDYSILGDVGPWQNISCTQSYNFVNKCGNIYENKQLTGMPCCKDSDCYSNKCNSNACKGYNVNEECDISEQCDLDLWCNKKKCTSVKDTNLDCSIEEQCKAGTTCSNGKCIKMFSLDIGSKATSAKACMSNFIANDICENIEIYSGSRKLEKPYICSIDDDCVYKLSYSGDVYMTNKCVCSGVNKTIGYCGEYAKYLPDVNDMWSEMQYTNSNCAGSMAHSIDQQVLYSCGSISYSLFMKFTRYYGQLAYFNIFNSEALKYCGMELQIFDPSYEFALEISGSWLIGLGSVLGLWI